MPVSLSKCSKAFNASSDHTLPSRAKKTRPNPGGTAFYQNDSLGEVILYCIQG